MAEAPNATATFLPYLRVTFVNPKELPAISAEGTVADARQRTTDRRYNEAVAIQRRRRSLKVVE